jgi:hypothetical protein
MSELPSSFRDFGILPDDVQPPTGTVRAFFSTGRVIGQYVGTAIVSALGLGLMVLFALFLPLPMSLLGCAAALAGFGTFVYLATHNDYRWVELDGNTLRARHLYTGRIIERSIDEIDSLGTMVYQVRSASTAVIERLMGRIKGIEIRFHDRRTPLRILRADPAMTNAEELIEAVLYRMQQLRKLEAEVVNWGGQPLVRRVFWKGEQPIDPPGKTWKVILCSLILLALLFGTILSFLALQIENERKLGSVPPHEHTLHSLIQDGPGANRHVVITGFRPGGYAVQARSDSWAQVWVALFPAAARPEECKEIKVVLSSKLVRNEADLRDLMRGGRVTGICSETPRSSWGTTLGPNLVQANHGCPLSSAWSIEEMREPPSAAELMATFAGGVACLVTVLILALIVFWKG